jgi:hypothetical protein
VKCHAENALTVLLPLSTEIARDDADVERVFELVGSCDGDQWSDAKLRDALQERAGLLHLTRRAKDWLVYWPTSTAPLWLFSPLRLPNLSEWGPGHPETSKVHRIAAFHGDLAVALSGEVSALTAERRGPSLRSLMADGGPVVLHHLAGLLRSSSDPVAGVVAEVR